MPIWSKNNLRPRLLLHGHHGVGNVGDDAMLRCAVDQLKASAPDLKITLSAGPMTDPAWCVRHGIRLISRSRTSLLKALRNHDALAVVGGTWIHSPVGKIRYDLVTISLALLLTAARAFGLRTALVGLGIGPIDKQFGNRIAGLACGRADFISARDPASWNWLNGARLKGVQTVRCADPAYAMSPGDLPRNPLRLGISALPYSMKVLPANSTSQRNQHPEERAGESALKGHILYWAYPYRECRHEQGWVAQGGN